MGGGDFWRGEVLNSLVLKGPDRFRSDPHLLQRRLADAQARSHYPRFAIAEKYNMVLIIADSMRASHCQV